MANGTFSFTTARHINASPAEVFADWTEPKRVQRWWGPDDGDRSDVQTFDVRSGGRYHVATHAPNGDTYNFTGEFKDVVPGKRVSFTWEVDDPQDQSIVTAEVEREGDGTLLTLKHAGFSKKSTCDGCEQGWGGALDKLERVHA